MVDLVGRALDRQHPPLGRRDHAAQVAERGQQPLGERLHVDARDGVEEQQLEDLVLRHRRVAALQEALAQPLPVAPIVRARGAVGAPDQAAAGRHVGVEPPVRGMARAGLARGVRRDPCGGQPGVEVRQARILGPALPRAGLHQAGLDAGGLGRAEARDALREARALASRGTRRAGGGLRPPDGRRGEAPRRARRPGLALGRAPVRPPAPPAPQESTHPVRHRLGPHLLATGMGDRGLTGG